MTNARVIDNPLSGERIIIRQSGAQTGGRLLAFDLFLPAGGHVPAAHRHPLQQERFTVVEGRVRFRLGRRAVVAGPGDTVQVEAGTAHWFGNAGDRVALTRVEVRPALRMQELLERNGAIAARPPCLTRLPELALVLLEFEREIGVPHLPAALVRAFLTPFGWLARVAR